MPGVENHAGEDLLEGFRAGRLEAFERLYEQAGPRMKSLAANLLGSREDAEDAVQETFLKVYRGASGFQGSSAVTTWAFRILLNTCYDAMRRRRRRPEDLGLDGLDLRLASGADHPLRLSLEKAVRQLPERERAAFLLVEVEGFSHREAAEVLDVPEATSRTLLFSARGRLKRALAPAAAGGAA
jgi:RNA polymerase sigma-70 factor (ECF subfamily)